MAGRMIVGVPKEIKNEEHRVGLLPDGAARLVARGHQVVARGATPVLPTTLMPRPARRSSRRTPSPSCGPS